MPILAGIVSYFFTKFQRILMAFKNESILLHHLVWYSKVKNVRMKISLWVIGKTNEKYLETGIGLYLKRISKYLKFEYTEFRDVKNFSDAADIKKKEGEMILQKLKEEDYLIVLDEAGTHLTSVGFAGFIEKSRVGSSKHMIFLVGGAFGVHDMVKTKAGLLLSLSNMTFSHQMIRLFFVEQLYRALTIIKNEKYHNP